jgi:hypothetical protein
MDYPGQDIFHETITVLDDNQEPSAENLALSVEGLADRTTHLYNRGMKSPGAIYGQCTAGGGDVVGVSGSAATWQDFPTADGVTPLVDVAGCEVGDVVLVDLVAGMKMSGTTDFSTVRLAAVQGYGGGSPVTAAVGGAISTVQKVVGSVDEKAILADRITLQGVIVITTAGTLRVKIQGRTEHIDNEVGILDGEYYSLRAVLIRPN